MKYDDITQKIIGAAYKVYNILGFGFLESVYKKALAIELMKLNLEFDEEKPLKIYYENKLIQ